MAGGLSWASVRASTCLRALLFILALVRLVDADGRRSFKNLSEVWMGQAFGMRGGDTVLPVYRGQQSTPPQEAASLQRLKQEGYDLRQGLHGTTQAWTYNCQMANADRIRIWGEEFKDSFCAMQGTQRTSEQNKCEKSEQNKGEKSIQGWSSATHDILEYKASRQGRMGQQLEGVLVMAPLGMHRIVKQVLLPTSKDLEGRAMGVWYSRGQFQFCVVSVYCPSGDRSPENVSKTERL